MFTYNYMYDLIPKLIEFPLKEKGYNPMKNKISGLRTKSKRSLLAIILEDGKFIGRRIKEYITNDNYIVVFILDIPKDTSSEIEKEVIVNFKNQMSNWYPKISDFNKFSILRNNEYYNIHGNTIISGNISMFEYYTFSVILRGNEINIQCIQGSNDIIGDNIFRLAFGKIPGLNLEKLSYFLEYQIREYVLDLSKELKKQSTEEVIKTSLKESIQTSPKEVIKTSLKETTQTSVKESTQTFVEKATQTSTEETTHTSLELSEIQKKEKNNLLSFFDKIYKVSDKINDIDVLFGGIISTKIKKESLFNIIRKYLSYSTINQSKRIYISSYIPNEIKDKSWYSLSNTTYELLEDQYKFYIDPNLRFDITGNLHNLSDNIIVDILLTRIVEFTIIYSEIFNMIYDHSTIKNPKHISHNIYNAYVNNKKKKNLEDLYNNTKKRYEDTFHINIKINLDLSEAYSILELNKDEKDIDVIFKRYRELILEFHPDKNIDKSKDEITELNRKFNEVKTSYDIIRAFLPKE